MAELMRQCVFLSPLALGFLCLVAVIIEHFRNRDSERE